MRRLNINFKDRKILSLVLCLLLISVFTLTIAYAALSAVLTINGTGEVEASSWNIKFANPRVTSGSVNSDVPTINGSTLSFNTTLTIPGDFYEFTVDVVNDGSVDAMISNFVKKPELTVEQAKFLKYEITYQNGEVISNQQLLAKNTSMPIKVRIEYRNDLVASDLPSTSATLNLSLTIEYIQSDGTGSFVKDNDMQIFSVDGDINDIGTIVTIGTERFYVFGTEGNNIKLISMYNLHVGYQYDDHNWESPLENPTGMQSELARGWFQENSSADPCIGTTMFSSDTQKGTKYTDYKGSIVEGYVNNYKLLVESKFGVEITEARIIKISELEDISTFGCNLYSSCSLEYPWIYSTSYWVDGATNSTNIWTVSSHNVVNSSTYEHFHLYGVRPVIIVSKDYFI